MFHYDTGTWPQTLDELIERPKRVATKWEGPYLDKREVLLDVWGHPYRYLGGQAARHNRGEFDLWSTGADGVDGTKDDITNWEH